MAPSRKQSSRKANSRKANSRKANSRKANSRKANSRKANSRKANSRKANSRKANSRKANSRKANSRKGPSRKQSGGANESLNQGIEFASKHVNQHGGALLTGSPVGYTGMLPDELRMAARIGGLDASLRETAGMSDSPLAQKGGRRNTRKSSKKSKKSSKKSKKSSKKSKKSSRQSGGSRSLDGAPIGESPMLLSPSQAARAGTADFSNPLLH